MKKIPLCQCLSFLVLFIGLAGISSPSLASVKYSFVVSVQPAEVFFKPLFAEIVLSNAAVSAGTASKGQIESVVFGGGSAMEEENRITLTYLHDDFIDLIVTLSADRQTITNISATLETSNSSIGSWVFHYQKPSHPTLQIHEFVGILKKDSISLETTILPVPPTHHSAIFKGEWKRTSRCWFLSRFLCSPFYFLPFCWLDVIVLSIATILLSGIAIFWFKKVKRAQE